MQEQLTHPPFDDVALDLRSIRIIHVIAKLGSFRSAAEELGTSQSSLSRRVQMLEHRLGVTLFDRSHKGARLNQAGSLFMDAVGPGIEHIATAIDTVTRLRRGTDGQIAVGFAAPLSSGYLRNVLSRFVQRHPNVAIKVSSDSSTRLLSNLRANQIDLAVLGPPMQANGLQSTKLWTTRMVVILPREHALAAQSHITWQALHGQRFVVSDQGHAHDATDYLIRQIGADHLHLDAHSVSSDDLMQMVAAGMGITLSCDASVNSHPGDIVMRPIEDVTGSCDVYAFWHAERANPLIRRFIEIARSLGS